MACRRRQYQRSTDGTRLHRAATHRCTESGASTDMDFLAGADQRTIPHYRGRSCEKNIFYEKL